MIKTGYLRLFQHPETLQGPNFYVFSLNLTCYLCFLINLLLFTVKCLKI